VTTGVTSKWKFIFCHPALLTCILGHLAYSSALIIDLLQQAHQGLAYLSEILDLEVDDVIN
jgi:hypothetical protein